MHSFVSNEVHNQIWSAPSDSALGCVPGLPLVCSLFSRWLQTLQSPVLPAEFGLCGM